MDFRWTLLWVSSGCLLSLKSLFVAEASFISVSSSSNSISKSNNQSSRTLLKMEQQQQELKSSATKPLPNLPLPEAICSTTPGTWAYDTMSRRVNNEILQRTYDDNQEILESKEFESIQKRFQDLRKELEAASTTKLTYLQENTYDDDDTNKEEVSACASKEEEEERMVEWKEWKELLQPFVENNDTWLTAPWMVTEFYVYRRLMQAFGYFDVQSPGYHYDPFVKQKNAGLVSSIGSAEAMLGKVMALSKAIGDDKSSLPVGEGLALVTDIALWGNKMDLSIWPADATTSDSADVFSKILATAKENLLHDDTSLLVKHCENLREEKGGGNIHIIVDNAGFELVTDLALGQYLIQSGIAKTVTFQLKSHPTFVSDAMEKDLLETIKYYASHIDPSKYPNAHQAGTVWKQFIENQQWICHEHRFWVQPYPMWEMTEPLRTNLANHCDLAFVKGDANYRRLLGDRLWDYTAPFQDVVGHYFPCCVCALRTLKAELGCGMDQQQVERAQSLDKNWLVNGRFGVIHFGSGASSDEK